MVAETIKIKVYKTVIIALNKIKNINYLWFYLYKLN